MRDFHPLWYIAFYVVMVLISVAINAALFVGACLIVKRIFF